MTDRYINRLNRESEYFKALNPVWDEYAHDGLNIFEMIDELNRYEIEYKVLLKDYNDIQETLYNLLDCFTCEDCINCIGFDDGYSVDFKCQRTGDWINEDADPCDHFRKCKSK